MNESLIDFYLDLYNAGAPIPDEYMQYLINEGYIQNDNNKNNKPQNKNQEKLITRDFSTINDVEKFVDENTIIANNWDQETLLTLKEYQKLSAKTIYEGKKKITSRS